MISIGKSSFSATDPASAVRKYSGSAVTSGTDVQTSDQVQLSGTDATLPQGRSEFISALKAIVSSPDYSPASLPISQKLVSEALSRLY
jgi:hypothetical protein